MCKNRFDNESWCYSVLIPCNGYFILRLVFGLAYEKGILPVQVFCLLLSWFIKNKYADLHNREHVLMKSVLVINLDVKDNHEEAAVGARLALDLCQEVCQISHLCQEYGLYFGQRHFHGNIYWRGLKCWTHVVWKLRSMGCTELDNVVRKQEFRFHGNPCTQMCP